MASREHCATSNLLTSLISSNLFVTIRSSTVPYATIASVTILVAFNSLSIATQAQETPFVEVSVEPREVLVGTPVTVQLALYVPTWFPSPPVFPSLELPNTITRRPANSSRPSSRTIGRKTWSGISRSYEIYPLIPGNFRLENENIKVKYADPGNPNLELLVQTEPVSFDAIVPEPASALTPYLAGTRVRVDRVIENAPIDGVKALTVGDTLTVSYRAEIDGLPALFLPELIEEVSVPGLSQYPGLAQLGEEGSLATRVETITYIFNAGGAYELPGLTLRWWNTDKLAIEETSLAPLPISVTGPSLSDETLSGESQTRQHWLFFGLIAALVLALWLLLKTTSVLKQRFHRYRQSEAWAWRALNRTLRQDELHTCYSAILAWLDRVSATDLAGKKGAGTFTGKSPGLTTPRELEKLRRCLYAGTVSSEHPDRSVLRKELALIRQQWLRENGKNPLNSLPTLNPDVIAE